MRAKALFTYDAQQSDELTVPEGSVLYIVEKDGDGSGWWTCELQGRKGMVPANYLEEIAPEPAAPAPAPAPAPAGPPLPARPGAYVRMGIDDGTR